MANSSIMVNSSIPGDHDFQPIQDLVSDLNACTTSKDNRGEEIIIEMYTSRTPSPTPSEQTLLDRKGVIDWKAMRNWRFWTRRQWLWYYLIFGVILTIVILVNVFDEDIVRWLQPTMGKMRDLPFGWLIPIAVFFVVSFPPLIGSGILAILCGVTWGLWIGFGITAAGTFLGELSNYYAFKYCCKSRAEKFEKKEVQYACLAKAVRSGGFKVVLVARYSAIPEHFTTAIFSTCGISVIVFAITAILSLPKHITAVYIGVALEQSGTGEGSKSSKAISTVVLAITIAITSLAMWYMHKKVDEVKHDVIYERRKTRQAKLERAELPQGAAIFIPNEPESNALHLGENHAHRRRDAGGHGDSTGFSCDPAVNERLHVPIPQRPVASLR